MRLNPDNAPREVGALQTGYERYTHDGEISSIQTQIRLFVALIERAFQKKEVGYAKFAIALNKHHLLRLLEMVSKLFPGVLDETAKAVLALPNGLERLEILNRIYLASRILDDVVDGDSPNKLSADGIVEFAERVECNFASGEWDKKSVVDMFYSQAMDICGRIGLDIKEQALAVIRSIGFDSRRRSEFMKTGERLFYPKDEIEESYYRLDIEGTIGACLELTNEGNTPEKRHVVEPLGKACRIFYDIRDLAIEVRDGLVNITAEDARKFGINMDELVTWAVNSGDLSKAPESVKRWIRAQTAHGKKLVGEFETLIAESDFQPLTLKIFKNSYLAQCNPFFGKMDVEFGNAN